MGMDAIGIELRFSQLLAECALRLYPEAVKEGCVEFSRDQILKICSLMAEHLETFVLRDSLGIINLRDVQYLLSNTTKLYTLLEWTFLKEEKLLFA